MRPGRQPEWAGPGSVPLVRTIVAVSAGIEWFFGPRARSRAAAPAREVSGTGETFKTAVRASDERKGPGGFASPFREEPGSRRRGALWG